MTQAEVIEQAEEEARKHLLTLPEGAPERVQWLFRAYISSQGVIEALRHSLKEHAKLVLSWPEVQARTLTVEDARALGCCRICKRFPVGVPTTLNFGEEFACTACLADEGWARVNKALEFITRPTAPSYDAAILVQTVKSILEGKS